MSPDPDPCAQLEALEGLDLDELRRHWRSRYGPPPRLRSPELLRLCLAWRLQAEARGGLDQQTRRLLNRATRTGAEARLAPGTTLHREWEGRIITVTAEAEGFRHEGGLHASLSSIARQVTGVRWNGPRFFGLRG